MKTGTGLTLGVATAALVLAGAVLHSQVNEYAQKLLAEADRLRNDATATLATLTAVEEVRRRVEPLALACEGPSLPLSTPRTSILQFRFPESAEIWRWRYRVIIEDERFFTQRGLFSRARHGLVASQVRKQLTDDYEVDLVRENVFHIDDATSDEFIGDEWSMAPFGKAIAIHPAWILPVPDSITSFEGLKIDAVATVRQLKSTYVGKYDRPLDGRTYEGHDLRGIVCIYSYPDLELIGRSSVKASPPQVLTFNSDGRSNIGEQSRELNDRLAYVIRRSLVNPDKLLAHSHPGYDLSNTLLEIERLGPRSDRRGALIRASHQQARTAAREIVGYYDK